jgi:hypothetical protein
MAQQAVQKRTEAEQALSYPALGAMIGGFVGLLGVFLGWFAHDVAVGGGETLTLVVRGTADLSGQLAAMGAVVAFVAGGGMLLMADAKINHWAAVAAASGAAFLLVFSVIGLLRAGAVFGDAAPLAASASAARSSFGAYLSALGGVIATAAAMVSVARDREANDDADADAA